MRIGWLLKPELELNPMVLGDLMQYGLRDQVKILCLATI